MRKYLIRFSRITKNCYQYFVKKTVVELEIVQIVIMEEMLFSLFQQKITVSGPVGIFKVKFDFFYKKNR